MVKFIFKVLLFLLPVAMLVFAFPTAVIILSREYYSPAQAIAAQAASSTTLYSLSYIESYAPYKEALVTERKPVIIAAGASRALEFRSEFFADPQTFTNAAIPGVSLWDIEPVLGRMISDGSVKVVILSVNPEDFDPSYDPAPKTATNNVYEWYREGWRSNYLDYFAGKFSLGELFTRAKASNDIGLPALIHNDGFRRDGSYQYGAITSDPNYTASIAGQVSTLVAQVNENQPLYFGATISQPALDSLQKLLALCKSRGVYVVGFLPPFPHPMYEAMLRPEYPYREEVSALPKTLAATFANYGFGFYDLSDAAAVGGGDSEFTDAGHGNDKLYLRVSMYLAAHDKTLAGYFDLTKMQALLSGSVNSYLPY